MLSLSPGGRTPTQHLALCGQRASTSRTSTAASPAAAAGPAYHLAKALAGWLSSGKVMPKKSSSRQISSCCGGERAHAGCERRALNLPRALCSPLLCSISIAIAGDEPDYPRRILGKRTMWIRRQSYQMAI